MRSRVPAALALVVLCFTLAATALPRPARAVDAGIAGADRFEQVKTWRLRVTWGMSGHEEKTDNFPGGDSRTVTWNASIGGRVDFRLERSERDMDPDVGWEWVQPQDTIPTGNVDFEAAIKQVDRRHDGQVSTNLQKAAAAGVKSGEGRFAVERATGSYRLFAFMLTAGGGIEMTATNPGGSSHTEFGGVSLSTGYGLSGPEEWTGSLPADTTQWTIRGEPRPILCTAPLAADGKRTMTVSWTLTPWDREPPGDVTFELEDKNWLPDPDEPCPVLVKWKGKATQVRVALADVSHEPGTCLNSAETGTQCDIRIPQQGEWTVEKDTCATWVFGENPPHEARLYLTANDYGGWGHLMADVRIDGVWKHAQEVRSGHERATVPIDDDGNHIADAWEDQYDVKGVAWDDDKDDIPPADGAHMGDGLTVYEEYRGFMEDGKHIRTNPHIMDLFLADETGGQAEAGANLFQVISQIKVHTKMTDAELGGAQRVINRNHSRGAHVVDQHGIPIKTGDANSTPEAIAATAGGDYGPPVSTLQVNLPDGRAWTRAGGALDPATEENISTIAHELGHCVAIGHHAKTDLRFEIWTQRTLPDGTRQIRARGFNPFTEARDTSDAPITVMRETPGGPVPFTEAIGSLGGADPVSGGRKMVVALQPSQYSGQENCVMRYPNANAYFRPEASDNTHYLPPLGDPFVRRDALCDDPHGTGINAPDHRPWPRYVDNPNGKGCKQQIRVSDRWAR